MTPLSRRQFLIRSGQAGLVLAGAGILGAAAYDQNGPNIEPAARSEFKMPDFSVAGAGKKLAIVRGKDRAAMLEKALAALGGLGAFVRPGDVVAIKVNAAFASPPILGATTHPDLLSAVVRLCLQAGAAKVTVFDNPINDPVACFNLSGLSAAAAASGAEVILPRADLFRPVSLPGGRLIRAWPGLAGPLERATKLVGLAPLKDHHRAGASMTMKNWYGLLGGQRNVFHQDINGIIKELALLVKPTLVVLDGLTAMVSNGPTGGSLSDLKETNSLLAGTDMVAVDAAGSEILGRRPADLPYLAQAEAAGAGRVDYQSLRPARLDLG